MGSYIISSVALKSNPPQNNKSATSDLKLKEYQEEVAPYFFFYLLFLHTLFQKDKGGQDNHAPPILDNG